VLRRVRARMTRIVPARFDTSDPAAQLNDLRIDLVDRFDRSGDFRDLNEAINVARQAVAASPAGSPELADYLSNLGVVLRTRFEYSGDAGDLDDAVSIGRQAVAACINRDDLGMYLYSLGLDLFRRFDRFGEPADLEEVTQVARQAISVTTASDEDLPGQLNLLATALAEAEIGPSDGLTEAVVLLRRAISSTPATHPDRPMYLSNLAGTLHTVAERTSSPVPLNEAAQAGQEAVDRTPEDDPAYAARLSTLGTVLAARAEYRSASDDLDHACGLLRRAVAHSAENRRELAMHRSNLGVVLLSRFDRTGALADLAEAVELQRRSVAATDADDPELPGRLSNLSGALLRWFEHTGMRSELDEAVDRSRQAGEATRLTDASRPMRLSILAVTLLARYEQLGAATDLDEAVEVGREAVASAADAARPSCLTNLSTALSARFERLGALADLDEAAERNREAVAITPADHPYRPARLSNLSTALFARFQRTAVPADLDEAIHTGREAAASVPVGNPNRAAIMSNLSLPLRTRFERRADPADANEAVLAARQAIAATPTEHPDHARYLFTLAMALFARYEGRGSPTDIDEAINVGRQAVAATLPGNPERAGWMSILGTALLTRLERTAAPADLDEAIGLFRDAAAVKTAPATVRAIAAQHWGAAAAGTEDWVEAVRGYTSAVELLGQTAPRALGRADQEHMLSRLTGVGADAAACCLQTGRADLAVQLWEQGRGVLLGQAMDTRTDLTALARQYPALAARFVQAQEELDRVPPAGQAPAVIGEPLARGPVTRGGTRHEVERRRKLAAAFDGVVEEIRSQRGFERFLLPPPVEELLGAAEAGPVILLNVSRFRSDALLLMPDGVRVVPLAGLTPEAVRGKVEEFLAALAGDAEEQTLRAVLGWLWDVAAGPALAGAGIMARPAAGAPWPRVWWCPSGGLSFLPVHAAGHHHTSSEPAPETVIDRAMSSYTPTVRGLLHARRRREDGQDAPAGRVVVVAMPQTPGSMALPGARREARLLQDLFGADTIVLEGPQGTRDAVLAALRRVRWAHFSCHGLNSIDDPSASHLLLHDHEARPLTVVDVARLRLDAAELAFLSACSTARTGPALADEAIHLVSAFQLAGYRHVIGTLWEVGDRIASRTATNVYTAITDAGGGAAAAAAALHGATRELRARLPNRPSAWAAHLHSGA
jgi:tetratricopeptide (TPR) repeat protein